MSEGSDKNGGWPRFNGTYKDYPAFRRKWNSYEKHHHQVTPQMELVQMFRENCISKELAYRIRRSGDDDGGLGRAGYAPQQPHAIHPGPDAGSSSIS